MLANHDPDKLRIQFEIHIQAPPEKVWAKMATLEGMNQWLARNLVFEHKVGGRFEMSGNLPGDGPYHFTGEVVTLEVEKELAFTWKHDPETGEAWPLSTLVTLRLEAADGGTHVTLTHSGFEALGQAIGKGAYEGHIQGWTLAENLNSLKAAVEAG